MNIKKIITKHVLVGLLLSGGVACAQPALVSAGPQESTSGVTVLVVKGQPQDARFSEMIKKNAWITDFRIVRPGLFKFMMVPEKQWDPQLDKNVIRYTKVMLPVFGVNNDWKVPADTQTAVIPLTKPFGDFAGHVFKGKVVLDGKPAPFTPVIVENYDVSFGLQMPQAVSVKAILLTDGRGDFNFRIPSQGWWGFAALSSRDFRLEQQRADQPIEIGAVLWTEFVNPSFK